MKKIAIIGCGWLGLPLAAELVTAGFHVSGSTTSSDKLTLLGKHEIDAYQIVVNDENIEGDITAMLQNAEVAVINIPPAGRSSAERTMPQKIARLVESISAAGVSKVLFTSSISVYPDNNEVITEASGSFGDSSSAYELITTENILRDGPSFRCTTLRLGGLTGHGRHPVYHLAGRSVISNPVAPINLVHRDDCVAVIIKIIEAGMWGETFNVVTPFHPDRKTYYTTKAIELGLSAPMFIADAPSVGKVISSAKLETLLGYQFKIIETI